MCVYNTHVYFSLLFSKLLYFLSMLYYNYVNYMCIIQFVFKAIILTTAYFENVYIGPAQCDMTKLKTVWSSLTFLYTSCNRHVCKC